MKDTWSSVSRLASLKPVQATTGEVSFIINVMRIYYWKLFQSASSSDGA